MKDFIAPIVSMEERLSSCDCMKAAPGIPHIFVKVGMYGGEYCEISRCLCCYKTSEYYKGDWTVRHIAEACLYNALEQYLKRVREIRDECEETEQNEIPSF